MNQVEAFRKAVNENKDWQEEIKMIAHTENPVEYAKSKGFEFTYEEYSDYLENHSEGELSQFEMEMVAGGRVNAMSCPSGCFS